MYLIVACHTKEVYISGALALAAAHNFLGVAERCEKKPLAATARGGGENPCYTAHGLAMLAARCMERARLLWRQARSAAESLVRLTAATSAVRRRI